MSEDLIIDTVGKFYAKVYDDSIVWLEKVKHRFPDMEDSEGRDDSAFARMIVHFTLCMVAAELQENEESNASPSLRYYIYDDGNEVKAIDSEISPVSAWLGDIVPGEGLLGLFANQPLPSTSIFDISKADAFSREDPQPRE
ncbi:hypothetical protein [Corynebacterium durum]